MKIFLKSIKDPLKKYGNPINLSYQMSFFSNYYKRESLKRVHNRLKYDEFDYIKNDEPTQERMILNEKRIYQSMAKQLSIYTKKYLDPSRQRLEVFQPPYPEKNGDFFYYSKLSSFETNDYEIIFRKNPKKGINEEIVLDLVKIPFLKKHQLVKCSLKKLVLSDNQDFLAFIVDANNDENMICSFRNLKTGKFMRDVLKNCSNIVFSKEDPSIVFYVEHDEKKRTFCIKRHEIGSDQSEDKLIHKEENEAFYLDIKISKDRDYIIVHSSSKNCNEILVMNRNRDGQNNLHLQKLIEKTENKKSFANHANNRFYLVVSEEGIFDSKLIIMDDSKFNDKKFIWEDYYIPSHGEIITELDLFDTHAVLYIQKDGISLIKILDKEKNIKEIKLNEEYGLIEPGVNEDYKTDEFLFHFSNPFISNSIFKYTISNQKIDNIYLSKLTGIIGPPIKRENFLIEKFNVPSHDGEDIPITLMRKRNIEKNHQNKVLLIGYGAYGQPIDLTFNIVNVAALENDWIIVFAHVRGGNEKGRNWHQNGRLEKKINSFHDFISVAEYLIAEKFTHPSLLCAMGTSAGGLLVATAINMRPELFKAAILGVPFLDVLNSLLDESLPLTLTDHEEFGNPISDQKAFENILSYCPYQNIRDTEYPAVLISTGTLDYRCPLWNVLKYTNKFRRTVKSPQKLSEFCPKNIIVSITESGHQGEVGTEFGILEKAEYFGFLDYVLFDANREIEIKHKFLSI